MTKTSLIFMSLFIMAAAISFTKTPANVQFYRAEEYNLTYALPADWETSEIPSQDNALLLGFHMPIDDEHSMILFSIPKEGDLEEGLVALHENAASVFSGEREENTLYESLIIDGMQAIDMQEIDYFHRILFINDIDRYIILVYRDPDVFDDPNYVNALETLQSSIALIQNDHPHQSSEADYIVASCRNGVEVIGYTGSDCLIRVPDQIDGKPVLSIGDGAFREMDIQHVVLPETVTRIGNQAFSSCSNLRSVSLPGQLVAIGEYSFELCEQLLSVSIPDSVISIGSGAFIGCVRLTEIRLPSSLAYLGNASLAATNIATITVDEQNAFFQVSDNVLFSKDCKKLIFYPQGRPDAYYQVPEGVEEISSFAFAQIDMMPYALQTVGLPSTLRQIGTGALTLLHQTEFDVPSSVMLIEADAFSKENDVTLYVKAGSGAEAYAIMNGLNFAYGR